MDKKTAENFMEALAWLEAPGGRLDILLLEIHDETEREKFKAIVGKLFSCHFELMMPIINQYPDLDPDNDGAEWYQMLRKKHLNK